MPKHTVNLNLTGSSGQVASQALYTAEQEDILDVPVVQNSTNYEIDFAIDISQVKSILLKCDRDLTVKTNSSGSPTNTIALKAGIPYIWNTDSYDTCKITADVTKLFVTLAAGANATFTIRVIADPTP